MMAALLALAGALAPVQDGDDNLAALVAILKETDDAAFQLDVLRGIRDGLKGRPSVKMPAGWTDVADRLAKSPNAEVRALGQSLSTTFGDPRAFDALRATLADRKAAADARGGALDALLGARDAKLPSVLLDLLLDPAMRGASIRGLASYTHPGTAEALLKVYGTLDVAERRDALNTLAARKEYARILIAALKDKTVPRADVSAATARQLMELGDAEVSSWIEKEWGTARATPADRLKTIAQWKEKYSKGPKGNPSKGRALFTKTCGQCHTLFDAGGKVGPELTGANRTDLDYVLQNILDPSALIGKDYQATMIRLKNERVISGIVKAETKDAVTIATENDVLTIPTAEIDARRLAEISMMPEGILNAFGEADIRDLFAYLMGPGQVPLPAAQAVELFNGKDLTGWDGDPAVWSVENGELVGKGPLKHNAFLFSKQEVADFRLIFEVKLTPDGGNSGVQFRSVPHGKTEAKGCQADIGAGWWGKLYEESARGLLFPAKGQQFNGDAFVKKGDWNVYEILAVGGKIRTAVNGNVCTVLDDDKVAMSGKIAPQVHSGGPMEVRFRKFQLELNPEFKLKTVEEKK
jgi:putative heme-binding domain-containing protein